MPGGGKGKGQGTSGDGNWRWTWQPRQRHQQAQPSKKKNGKSNSERSGGKYLACHCGGWSWLHRAGDACHQCGTAWGHHWFGPSAQTTTNAHTTAAAQPAKPTVADQVAAGVLTPEQWEKIKEAAPCLELLGCNLPKVVVAKVSPPEPPTAATASKEDLLKQLQNARARRIQADRTAAAKQEQLKEAAAAYELAQQESEDATKAAKEAAATESNLEVAFGQKVAPLQEEKPSNKKEEPKKDEKADMSDDDVEPDEEMAPPGSAERRAYDQAVAATSTWQTVKRQRRQTIIATRAAEAGNAGDGGQLPAAPTGGEGVGKGGDDPSRI